MLQFVEAIFRYFNADKRIYYENLLTRKNECIQKIKDKNKVAQCFQFKHFLRSAQKRNKDLGRVKGKIGPVFKVQFLIIYFWNK